MVRVVGKFGLGMLLAPIWARGGRGRSEGFVRTIMTFSPGLISSIPKRVDGMGSDVEGLRVVSTGQYQVGYVDAGMYVIWAWNQVTRIGDM